MIIFIKQLAAVLCKKNKILKKKKFRIFLLTYVTRGIKKLNFEEKTNIKEKNVEFFFNLCYPKGTHGFPQKNVAHFV